MAEKIWHCLPRHRLSHLVEYFPLLFIFCRFFKIGLFFLCVFVCCGYICVCIFLCVGHTYIGSCTVYVCGHPKLMSRIFLSCSPSLFIKAESLIIHIQSLSMELVKLKFCSGEHLTQLTEPEVTGATVQAQRVCAVLESKPFR